jgi:DNA-binding TFAR19-related protein (PDSD5 family)
MSSGAQMMLYVVLEARSRERLRKLRISKPVVEGVLKRWAALD